MAFELQLVRVKLQGLTPLLMNNGLISPDPLHKLNKLTKTFTSKRKKTDDDLQAMQKIEWYKSLYLDGPHEIEPIDHATEKKVLRFGDSQVTQLPGTIIKACLVKAATKTRMGTVYKQSLRVDATCQLDFDGDRDPNLMYEQSRFLDTRPVVVQRSRLMRTRPKISNWDLSFNLKFFSDKIDIAHLKDTVTLAGQIYGICDFRPATGGEFGQFICTEFEQLN